MINVPEDDAKKILVNSMFEIEKSLSKIESGSSFINSIEDLSLEIKPDIDIVQFTMDRIREDKE